MCSLERGKEIWKVHEEVKTESRFERPSYENQEYLKKLLSMGKV